MTMLLTALTVALLTGVAVRLIPGWADRQIRPLAPWPVTLAAQGVAALGAAWFTAPVFGTPAAVAAAAAAWLSVLAVVTDLACRKIPYDIFLPVTAVGLGAAAFAYSTVGLLSFGFSLVALVLLPLGLRALTNQGLGMSDVRLLWAYTATLSWWVGQTWLVYGLGIAALLQGVVRMIAGPLGWGEMVPRDRTLVVDGMTREERAHISMRRELPFAPAIVAGMVTMTVYAVVTGQGACAMWTTTGVCG